MAHKDYAYWMICLINALALVKTLASELSQLVYRDLHFIQVPTEKPSMYAHMLIFS